MQRLLMNTEQLEIARNIPLFAGLTEKEKDSLLDSRCVFSYPKKKHLFMQGDPVKYFYIVCSGVVQELRPTTDGDEITVSINRPGDILGKVDMFLETDIHQTSAIVINDACVMELPMKEFREKLLGYPSAVAAMMASLAQLSHVKQIEVEQQATMTSTEIVACFLRRMCSKYNLDPCGFTLPYKKSLIASRLGMELETFSRTLPKLEEHGIIVKGTHVAFSSDLARKAQEEEECRVVVPFRGKWPAAEKAKEQDSAAFLIRKALPHRKTYSRHHGSS